MFPKLRKKPVTIDRLASDNNVFLVFHLDFFFLHDQDMMRTLLRGDCQKWLYPVHASPIKARLWSQQTIFLKDGIIRIGHPGAFITQIIIRNFNLPCIIEYNNTSVCDAYQQAKSHQLSYSKSTIISIVLCNLFSMMFCLMEWWSPLSRTTYEIGGNHRRMHDVWPERVVYQGVS